MRIIVETQFFKFLKTIIMKTKLLFTVLFCSIFTVMSCKLDPVLPNKEPICDPPINKKTAVIRDTALLPPKTVYDDTND